MREENLECDICHKKMGVEYTSSPHDTDYWECEPVEKHKNGWIHAVLMTPDYPKQICDDCFQKMLKAVGYKPIQRGEVLTFD